VGFFNQRTALGRVLPELFHTSRWTPAFGVTDPESTRHQLEWVAGELDEIEGRAFVFVNVSAIHQPNCLYVEGRDSDDLRTHAAALQYVDAQLPILFDALAARGRAFVIVCSDHGTAYGEDGFHGHRCAHPTVWNVPYRHFFVGDDR
jgi:arylsulfatase A-like enzyme